MPLTVDATREGPPWPVPTIIILHCDGPHVLTPASGDAFTHYAAAMAAGWKETFTKDGRKLWLGPCCSGKRRA